jgi:pimeloyl-ACP methyl ester carboxylesterase
MAMIEVAACRSVPDRDPAELDPDVWEPALDMCRGVFAREWTGPLVTDRQLQPPASGRLPEVRVPALVINGLADVPGIQEVAGLLADGIAGARRLDLPTGHLPPLEQPSAVSAALAQLLAAA